MHIDHASIAPLYTLAGIAILVLVADLFIPPRWRSALLGLTGLGVAATAVVALTVTGGGHRASFCVPGASLNSGIIVEPACSYVTNSAVVALTVALCAATLIVVALSAPTLTPEKPAGEYCFLLLCSLLGAVVLVGSRDLMTLIVATEALTLPLYVLVGLSGARRGIESATTFFMVSVVSTAVSLLGAGLLYALVGVVHLHQIATVLSDPKADLPTAAYAAGALLLAGLLFKLAAAPFHGWAPGTYDWAPIPVTAFVSTVSKIGGLVAVVLVMIGALGEYRFVLGVTLAVVAVASMTVGNLAALRQHRMPRLIAWSAVAQLGYVLAPVAVAGWAERNELAGLLEASLSYVALYALVVLVVFGALVLARPGATDGGRLDDYRGLARRRPWAAAVLLFGLAGLAGLPPALGGLFAKLMVLRGLVDAGAGWLAVVVAVNAVIGLAVYGRVAMTLFARTPYASEEGDTKAARVRPKGTAIATAGAAAAVAATVAVGFVPQPLFTESQRIADNLAKLLM